MEKNQKAMVKSKVTGNTMFCSWNGSSWEYLIGQTKGFLIESNAEVIELL